MDKHDNYSAAAAMVPSLSELDYSTMIPAAAGGGMVDYMVNEVPPPDQFGSGSSHMMDRSFSAFTDVLQFADFGPKLALHHHSNEPGNSSHDALADPAVYMLKFPVLNGEDDGEGANDQPHQDDIDSNEFLGASGSLDQIAVMNTAGTSSNPAGTNNNNNNNNNKSNKNNGKRKRARAVKTTEEAESQRMTHIAVERNRRKQMNEHLRVLRTLMPSSYVQRGDQASIVGGAIEFVRELEELLQCLESQKRRKLYGEAPALPLPNSQPFDPANDQIIAINDEDDNTADVGGLMMVAHNAGPAVALTGLQEEAAESKTDVADVEVKLLGFDAFIKILSRRRPGQLIKAISGLQALHFTILHTNITTIEQTVLYSFNIKISSETRFTAEDIATSVQHIFTFIHSNQDM